VLAEWDRRLPATSNAACLLGISSLVCNNGVLTSPTILNVGPYNTGIANIGAANTGLGNVGAFNIGALNLGNFHSGILGLG
jgi:pentapeptide repeat protein